MSEVKILINFSCSQNSLRKLVSVAVCLLYFAIASVNTLSFTRHQSRAAKSVRQDRYGILLKAVEAGDIKGVRKLIRRGIKVDPKNKGETTALMMAARRGNLEIVKMLLTAGANPNASTVTRHGEWDSPLISAMGSKGDRLRILDTLIAGGADVNPRRVNPPVLPPLFYAIGSGDALMVEELLKRRADINFKFRNQVTPLMLAVSSRNSSMVKRLIAAGADVNLKNDLGQTALSLAQEENNEEIVLILQQAGAKPDDR